MTFLEHINANLGIAHKVCNIYFRDSDDRQDVMQEMMYQLWRSYPGFDGRSKFSTWMYRVCLNTALTYKKKSKSDVNERLSNTHDRMEEVSSEEVSSKEAAVDLLTNAIATLSPVNKAIMLLYLEEMSYEEIADVMGLTRSNVSVRIMRAKKELEEKLKHKML
jgi:RNA polymerase sigma factor (sigma-70 family)